MSNIFRILFGRYGIDNLSKFLFWLYIIMFIISLFYKNFVFDLFSLFILFVLIFRFFSKNISKRSRENQMYLKFVSFVLKPFKNAIRRFKERNDNVYKRCFRCGCVLRLPLPFERGVKHAKCPNCKRRVTFLCLRKQKVEIITERNGK